MESLEGLEKVFFLPPPCSFRLMILPPPFRTHNRSSPGYGQHCNQAWLAFPGGPDTRSTHTRRCATWGGRKEGRCGSCWITILTHLLAGSGRLDGHLPLRRSEKAPCIAAWHWMHVDYADCISRARPANLYLSGYLPTLLPCLPGHAIEAHDSTPRVKRWDEGWFAHSSSHPLTRGLDVLASHNRRRRWNGT